MSSGSARRAGGVFGGDLHPDESRRGIRVERLPRLRIRPPGPGDAARRLVVRDRALQVRAEVAVDLPAGEMRPREQDLGAQDGVGGRSRSDRLRHRWVIDGVRVDGRLARRVRRGLVLAGLALGPAARRGGVRQHRSGRPRQSQLAQNTLEGLFQEGCRSPEAWVADLGSTGSATKTNSLGRGADNGRDSSDQRQARLLRGREHADVW
jgi:hypothetical protein